jgi:hypothetical protein
MRQSTTVHRKVANLSKSASKLTPAKALAKTGTDDADEWAEF